MEVQNNKLIADFMGAKYDKDTHYTIQSNNLWLPNHGICRHDTIDLGAGKILKYHKSWDWLIPVVEKIEALGFYTSIRANKYSNGNTITTIENSNEGTIAGNLLQLSITEQNLKVSKIESVYTVVVEFIKWYNENH